MRRSRNLFSFAVRFLDIIFQVLPVNAYLGKNGI